MNPSLVAENILQSVSMLPGPAAYATIVGILFICGMGIPIPEDITLLAAGLLAAYGRISFAGALAAGFLGVLLGDALLFFLGRHFGKKIFALRGFRKIFTPERIAAAEHRIRKNGPFICFVARFLPGLRSPIFAMAGALGVRRSTFFLLDGFAAALSVPIWVYLGFWLGKTFEDALSIAVDQAKEIQLYVFATIAVIVLGYIAFKVIKRRRARFAHET